MCCCFRICGQKNRKYLVKYSLIDTVSDKKSLRCHDTLRYWKWSPGIIEWTQDQPDKTVCCHCAGIVWFHSQGCSIAGQRCWYSCQFWWTGHVEMLFWRPVLSGGFVRCLHWFGDRKGAAAWVTLLCKAGGYLCLTQKKDGENSIFTWMTWSGLLKKPSLILLIWGNSNGNWNYDLCDELNFHLYTPEFTLLGFFIKQS